MTPVTKRKSQKLCLEGGMCWSCGISKDLLAQLRALRPTGAWPT